MVWCISRNCDLELFRPCYPNHCEYDNHDMLTPLSRFAEADPDSEAISWLLLVRCHADLGERSD